jgi:hypothetical protein
MYGVLMSRGNPLSDGYVYLRKAARANIHISITTTNINHHAMRESHLI